MVARELLMFQMKERLDSYTAMLDRQCTMVDLKSQRQSIPLQRSLVDTRSYAAALMEKGENKLRRCTSLEELPPYGLYEGVTWRELRPDIERIKSDYRPEKVRARKNQRLLREGTKEGRILPQHEVPFKFHDLMTRKYDPDTGRFVTRDSNMRPGFDLIGNLLPPLKNERNLVTLHAQPQAPMQRSLTYYGARW